MSQAQEFHILKVEDKSGERIYRLMQPPIQSVVIVRVTALRFMMPQRQETMLSCCECLTSTIPTSRLNSGWRFKG